MQHLGTIKLETDRLILRRFTMDDAMDMYRNWASDPEVTKFLTWKTYESPETADTILKIWVENYEQPDFYQWAIELKEIGQPVGSISVVRLNNKVESAEIGYCIGRKWWKQGITSEALERVMRFLFDEVGVNRVEARHDVNNPNSGKVMQKCGMTLEGILRQADMNNQGLCDEACYAILKNER